MSGIRKCKHKYVNKRKGISCRKHGETYNCNGCPDVETVLFLDLDPDGSELKYGETGEIVNVTGIAINESDPNGVDQHAPGAKLDAGKLYASLLEDFSLALKAVAEVATFGAKKYTRGGWQSVKDGRTRYKDAEWRHQLESRHEKCDKDSGLPHKWHRAWNVLAELELELREGLNNEKN